MLPGVWFLLLFQLINKIKLLMSNGEPCRCINFRCTETGGAVSNELSSRWRDSVSSLQKSMSSFQNYYWRQVVKRQYIGSTYYRDGAVVEVGLCSHRISEVQRCTCFYQYKGTPNWFYQLLFNRQSMNASAMLCIIFLAMHARRLCTSSEINAVCTPDAILCITSRTVSH